MDIQFIVESKAHPTKITETELSRAGLELGTPEKQLNT